MFHASEPAVSGQTEATEPTHSDSPPTGDGEHAETDHSTGPAGVNLELVPTPTAPGGLASPSTVTLPPLPEGEAQGAGASPAASSPSPAVQQPAPRALYQILGVLPGGRFALAQEIVLAGTARFLAASGRVYRRGDDLLYEDRPAGEHPRLVPLAAGGRVDPAAADRLANLMVCVAGDGQFPPPPRFVRLLLRSEPLRDALPVVRQYATRPVFDAALVLRGPGWHPDAGVLVHGPAVTPTPWTLPPPGRRAVDRLPPLLRGLLGDFCFREDADLANALALLLTALLAGRYVGAGKPVALIDGNQSGLGKTLLARVAGVLADGHDPVLVRYAADDELHKRIGAHLKAGRGSVLVVDNAKVGGGGAVGGPTLESMITSPVVAARVLGTSTLVSRPNDLLWCVTMNDTRVSADLASRGLPVRLTYEGDPARRAFAGDPVAFALANRVGVLGELAGMVEQWTAVGRPAGVTPHRFREWAAEVGGVLWACGFPEVLANAAAAAEAFTAAADDLAALAEFVAGRVGPEPRPGAARDAALKAGEWVPLLAAAGVGDGDGKPDRARAIRVGKFLGQSVGRAVTVWVGDAALTATLRSLPGRAREVKYFFELVPAAPGVLPAAA